MIDESGPSNFQEFLDSKTEIGQFHSASGFTLSAAHAIEKLGQSLLTEPGDWVLKMVQAAVVAKASKLEFKQGRSQLTLTFDLASCECARDLPSTLFNPAGEANPFLTELNMGLRAVLSNYLMQVLVREDGPLEVWTWNGQGLVDEKQEDSRVRERTFTIVLKPMNKARIPAADLAEQIQALQNRAVFGPVPIWVDGRRLTAETILPRSHFQYNQGHSPRNLALIEFTPNEDLTSATIGELQELEANWLDDHFRTPAPFMHWKSQEPASNTLALWASHAGRKGREQVLDDRFKLLWTRHGVVCAASAQDRSKMGGYLSLRGDHFRTDISGLNLQVDSGPQEGARKRLALTAPLMRPIAQAVYEHTPGFLREDSKPLARNAALGAMAGGAFVVIGTSLALPLILAGAVLGAVTAKRDTTEVMLQISPILIDFERAAAAPYNDCHWDPCDV